MRDIGAYRFGFERISKPADAKPSVSGQSIDLGEAIRKTRANMIADLGHFGEQAERIPLTVTNSWIVRYVTFIITAASSPRLGATRIARHQKNACSERFVKEGPPFHRHFSVPQFTDGHSLSSGSAQK